VVYGSFNICSGWNSKSSNLKAFFRHNSVHNDRIIVENGAELFSHIQIYLSSRPVLRRLKGDFLTLTWKDAIMKAAKRLES